MIFSQFPCWVIGHARPASMKLHVSSIVIPGKQRFVLVPVSDHHSHHVEEGRGGPLSGEVSQSPPASIKRVANR